MTSVVDPPYKDKDFVFFKNNFASSDVKGTFCMSNKSFHNTDESLYLRHPIKEQYLWDILNRGIGKK